jgi:beta-lactamase class A
VRLPTAARPASEHVTHCLLDAQGAVLSAAEGTRRLYAASTIKLHVLWAALRACERAELRPGDTVAVRRSFRGAGGDVFALHGEHLDPTHPADGTRLSIAELMRRMIDRSSNEATNHLIEMLGLRRVAEGVDELGLSATSVRRMIGDPAAVERGLANGTCAADLARTLLALVRGTGLSESSHRFAAAALEAQRIRIITPALRAGVPSGSKSGWVDGYRHDAAFLGAPGSSGMRVLAVMTAGMDEARADSVIAGTARTLLPDLAG